MKEIETHYRTCNLCEAMCGIEIRHRGQDILSIRGDTDDTFSRGHICPKAVALQDFYHDPDRLKQPLRRRGSEWETIGWDEALDETTARIRGIQDRYGKDTVATYLGNPNAHNLGNTLFLPHFIRALDTRNRYSATSLDQLPHHVASHTMLGHGMLIPVPDIDRTQFMLIIGANPLVSNGSMMTSPDFARRMKAVRQRGGKIVVVDPRRTETARKADEHLFIRPERDALLLAALIHTILAEGLDDVGHLAPVISGMEKLEPALRGFSADAVAERTGVTADKIRELARQMASAPAAVCYSRMGASTQTFGGLCQWLTNVLNIVTGNFDREGGAMFTLPAFDVVAMSGRRDKPDSYGRYVSRVRGLPYLNNEFPAATLADEILAPGDGQVRGLVCVAGNPVLSSPNGVRLDAALAQLDFMVAIDIYLNETTRRADIILPATTGLETSHYDIVFHVLAIHNTAKYSRALYDRGPDQRHDWEIVRGLTARLQGVTEPDLTPEDLLDGGLRAGPYGPGGMCLDRLYDHPHGLDLGPLTRCLADRLQTADGRLHIAPDLLVSDLLRLNGHVFDADSQFPFALIGRRLLRSHNTWTKNAYRLVKGRNACVMLLNPADAQRLGIHDGADAEVTSRTGMLRMPVKVSDEIMPGVVCIPQGWGHNRNGSRQRIAAAHAGASINDLTDHNRLDALTGNAAFNGVPVAVSPVAV